MSKVQLESLEDLLQVDTDTGKATENKDLLKQVKQLIKKVNKKEVNLDKKAEDLPYEAVSVVGNRFVTLKFDINTREAVVTDIKVDSRDVGKQQHMAFKAATDKLRDILFKHKGDNGDE